MPFLSHTATRQAKKGFSLLVIIALPKLGENPLNSTLLINER